jgi:hypothetical protein
MVARLGGNVLFFCLCIHILTLSAAGTCSQLTATHGPQGKNPWQQQSVASTVTLTTTLIHALTRPSLLSSYTYPHSSRHDLLKVPLLSL